MQREDQTDGVPASIVTSPENQPVRNSDVERFGCPIKTGQSRGSLSLRRQRQSEKSRINASVAIKWPIAGNAYNEKHTIRSTQPRARRLQASSRNTIELGPDGNSYRRTYDFSELNGMQLNGQTVSIDLVFSTQVHLFRNSLDFLIFFTFLTSGGESFITGTGYVTNALGNPMTATDGRLWSASTTDTMFVGLSPCDFGLERPSDIYGTHFDLTFLTSTHPYSMARCYCMTSNLSRTGAPFRIGPYVPDSGPTVLLLAVALVPFAAFGVRTRSLRGGGKH